MPGRRQRCSAGGGGGWESGRKPGKVLGGGFVHSRAGWIGSNRVACQSVWFRLGGPPGGMVSAVSRVVRAARPVPAAPSVRRSFADVSGNCNYRARSPFGLRSVCCRRGMSSGLSDSSVCRVSARHCGYRDGSVNSGRTVDFGVTGCVGAVLGSRPPSGMPWRAGRSGAEASSQVAARNPRRRDGVRRQQRLPQEADRNRSQTWVCPGVHPLRRTRARRNYTSRCVIRN